ncbi:MAG: ectoine/hydroxyectoine ABC transporter ATP-binding protein EhuA [Actinomycetota bacterium]
MDALSSDPRATGPQGEGGAISESAESGVVSFRKVSKHFQDIVALQDVDLDVASGERLAVIGRSGSGKSTLLRVLIGLERPTSGSVEVDGEPLWHMKRNGQLVPANDRHLRAVRRKLGMVFQAYNLFPHMTVLGNLVEGPIHVLGMSKEEAVDLARRMLEMVGLTRREDAYPSQLSGGQQQRVAIARALAMDPEILLFDEITSALDPELIAEVLGVLRKLAHESSKTMLIVTHEMRFARDVADRIVFFDEGRIVEVGSPQQLFVEPTNPRTRAFLKDILEAR